MICVVYCDVVGPVALSTQCKLVSPGAVVSGTMSITKAELYFEMDEEDPDNKKLDPKVCVGLLYFWNQYCQEKQLTYYYIIDPS